MSNLKFIRTPKNRETKFLRVDLGIYRNDDLSLSAIGLLSYLLSHNENYNLSKENIAKKFNMPIKSFRKVWKELIDAGYIMETKKHIDGRYKWFYTIGEFSTGSNTTGSNTTGCNRVDIRTIKLRTTKLRTTKPLKEVSKDTSYGDIEELSKADKANKLVDDDNDKNSSEDEFKLSILERLKMNN